MTIFVILFIYYNNRENETKDGEQNGFADSVFKETLQ